jgi:hypothetical protein
MGVGLRFALFLGVLLVLPVAAADHVFSHRVYVVGRVLDAEGRPAAGVTVSVTFEGINGDVRCLEQSPDMTGPRGDYEVCRHVHAMPSHVSATVRAGNVTRSVNVDPDLRAATASLQLDASAIHDVSGERQFARTFDVVGRAFTLLPRPSLEENVLVNATPLFDNVSIELLRGEEVLASAEVTPDEYGTYRASLAIDEIPAGAIVRAHIGSDRVEALASAQFRRADVSIVRDLRLIEGPGDDAPGSSPTPWGVGGALVALTCAAAVRWRRPAE